MNEGREFDPLGEEDSAKETAPLLAKGSEADWEPVEDDDEWVPDSQMHQLEVMMGQDDPPAGTEITASGTFDSPAHHNPMPSEDATPRELALDSMEAIVGNAVSATKLDKAELEVVEAEAESAKPDGPEPAKIRDDRYGRIRQPAPPIAPVLDAAPSSVRGDETTQGPTLSGIQDSRSGRRPSRVQQAYNSNEAIHGSDIVTAVGDGSTRSSSRERLPSRADAPAHPVHEVVESRPVSWLVPGIVFVGGSGVGAYVCIGASPILGGIAIALSMVGSLFLRVLLGQ